MSEEITVIYFEAELHPHWVGDHSRCDEQLWCRRPHGFRMNVARWVHTTGEVRVCLDCTRAEDDPLHRTVDDGVIVDLIPSVTTGHSA